MQLNGRDRALKVTADGKGLAGHAGAVPLREAAGQAGLTSGLSAALVKKTTSPLLEVVVRTDHQPDRDAWLARSDVRSFPCLGR